MSIAVSTQLPAAAARPAAVAGAALLLALLAAGGFALAPARQGVGSAYQLPKVAANDITQLQVQASSGHDAAALAQLTGQADAGNPQAQRALGLALIAAAQGADTPSALSGVDSLRQAAARGDAQARVGLGKLYLQGSALVARDYGQSLRWFKLAARDNEPAAAYYLGVQYSNGYGVLADAAAAFQWFLQAAQRGVPAAMFRLANAYRYGQGVAVDNQKAVASYEAAAELEYPPAVQTLAMAYLNGEMGLPADGQKFQQYLAETGHSLKHPALEP